MNKSIFIATAEPNSGKSIIALGLVDMLLSKAQKIGYFKPIIHADPRESRDVHIDTIVRHFNLQIAYEDTWAYTGAQALKLIESGNQGEIIDAIIAKYKQLEEAYDFTVVEGSDFLGEGIAFEFDANVSIAKNLGAPVIIVVTGEGKTTAQIINSAITILRNFQQREVQVLAIVANKVKPEQAEDVRELLQEQLPQRVILSVIPEDRSLKSPTMKDILNILGGRLMFGEQLLTNQADHFIMGAMQVPNFLNHIKENVLIVTPGDRSDIIMTALQANISANYPKVAGMVLTGGFIPEEQVQRLIEGLQTVVPMIAVKEPSFQTATRIGNIQSRITADNERKIRLGIDTFKRYVDVQALDERIVTYTPEGMTPHMFQYQLVKWAKSQRKHIVLPEGNDERILRAAGRLISQDVVDLTLLGDPAQIRATINRLGLAVNLDRLRIINPATSDRYEEYVHTLYELRKSKNMELEMARDLMTDVSYFGTMMVYKGHADGMVSGAIHTTQHTIRPALQFVKTRPGFSVVSSVFFMCLPDRVSVFGDCAVNPNPTAEQLAEIAISSADSSKRFGIEPKVAMLSYSSGASGEGADVEKVRRATEIVKQRRPDLKVEGPIQYDAAVDPQVGRQKLPGSEVAGQASVLIFPDLNTGNNTYKAVQRETGALAIGPMLQGLNKPVNDLSRGCTVEDIFNTVVITAIQAQE
ncbi:phosphate acetyltransferase [Cesiribacter andamanensis]|uniref:Phosphate acetyltransferase n=1 Tax=Cesiribacter andamanensis AMV16 TaxID=1279009 RepID=M7NVA7_9BACT|nr:phosphate acetyltransferase [Cesiribacter andamanensis]EMR02394.1 Phosphate acetyltransferase [Cesiribacter andamanensis AMV16]